MVGFELCLTRVNQFSCVCVSYNKINKIVFTETEHFCSILADLKSSLRRPDFRSECDVENCFLCTHDLCSILLFSYVPSCVFLLSSNLSRSAFDTVSTWLTALSNLLNSVLPGTFGGGKGFMFPFLQFYTLISRESA